MLALSSKPALVTPALVALLTLLQRAFLPDADVQEGLLQEFRTAADQDDVLATRATALRGCCGQPAAFRWVLPQAPARAGELLRTRLLAVDAQGRPARATACAALHVNVSLSGNARVVGTAAWRGSELHLDLVNEAAEEADAQVRIQGPDQSSDALLHTARVSWVPGLVERFNLSVGPVGGGGALEGAGADTSSQQWPTQVVLEARLSGVDRFGNEVDLAGSCGAAMCSASGSTWLRVGYGSVELLLDPSEGALAGSGQGGAQVQLLRGLAPGTAELYVDHPGQGLLSQDVWKLTFVDYVPPVGAGGHLEGAPGNLSKSDAKWAPMAGEVRDAFLHAWRGYKRYAWGQDELKPLSKKGTDTFGNVGMMILDSLTTLKLLGLEEEFERAAKFVDKELSFDSADRDISVFEVTIRALGGLLGAHALTGRRTFLERAEELGRRLLPALNTTSGLPRPRWNIARQGAQASDEPTILAEAGSLQLEFRYLSALTGDARFRQAADRCFEAVQEAARSAGVRGLLPVHLTPPHVAPPRLARDKVALGALADSYYEYILKQWLQSPGETRFRDLWFEVLDDMPKLVRGGAALPQSVAKGKPHPPLRLVEMEPSGSLIYKTDHLSCFAPGMIALALRNVPASDFGERNRSLWRHIAEGTAAGCMELWASTASGLAPEYALLSERGAPQPEFSLKPVSGWTAGRHSFLRPETAESLFYLHRLTGDAKYRRMGKKMFHAIVKHAKVDAGFASVRHVDQVPTQKLDEMQSFVMAETFKYLFLLFSPAEALDLDKYVLNTEAHPLRVLGPF